MVRKLSTLFESIGAISGDTPGRLHLPSDAVGVASLFGGDVSDAEIEVLSDEAFVFKSPPEMVGIGPLWVAGLDSAGQLKSAVKDAHARMKARLTNDQEKLEALGMKPKLLAPEPVAAADLTLGGHVATVTLDATGALLVVEVSGRRVPQKSQQLGLAIEDASADLVRGSIAELVQKMQRAGLLTGRGMFDAATVRGPYAVEPSENKDALPSVEAESREDASIPSSSATALASAGEEASTPRADVRRVPRPKRRSSEDARSSSGGAARSSTGSALRSSVGSAIQSSTGASVRSSVGSSAVDDAISSTTGNPSVSRIEGDESLLPSPAVDMATTRPAQPRSVTLARASSNSDGSSDSGKTSNPFGKRSTDTGVNVGFAKERASDVDAELQANGFDAGQDTGVVDALPSVSENSEEELLRAMEEFSSEESDDSDDDPLAETHTSANDPELKARTAEAPGSLAPTAMPGPDPSESDVEPPELSEEDGLRGVLEGEDDDEPTTVAASFVDVGARSGGVERAASKDEEKSEPKGDEKPTDKLKPVKKPTEPDASLDAAWRAAETAAKSTSTPPATASEVPINFDIDASTGEHPRTVSAEQTFNALQGVVGEGLSTGKTGAFILDADAFAYLRGDAASDDIAALESEITELETRLAESRSKLVALKAGKLRAVQEAETTAPKGRLAEKKKRMLEERDGRGRSSSESGLDLPSLASDIEPVSHTGPAEEEDDDERAPSDPGVALADVARALADDDAPRADATQMVAAAYSDLDVPDDEGVFDSRQEGTGAMAVEISMNSLDGEPVVASAGAVDVEGETRVADVRSLSGALGGPIGIVVADARALDRLSRHLEEEFESIVGLSVLPPTDEVDGILGFRALVVVRPKPDEETFARLSAIAAHRRRPQILCLSADDRFEDAAGIDLRLELAKKAGEVAQQVIDGLRRLGVSPGARVS